MGSTDSRLSCLCAAGTVPVPRGQASTRVLGRFDPLPPYGNFHQVSSPLSQSLAAPCIHHPLKGNEQLEASRKPADPLAFKALVLSAFSMLITRSLQAASLQKSQGWLSGDASQLLFMHLTLLLSVFAPLLQHAGATEATHPHSTRKTAFHRHAAACQHR